MGILTSYALLTAIYLFVGWGVYRLILASCKQPAFNRLIILCIYIVAMLSVPAGGLLSKWLSIYDPADRGGIIDIPEVLTGLATQQLETPLWVLAMTVIYITGVAVTFAVTGIGLIRTLLIIRRGEKIRRGDYTLLITDNPDIIPFSWGRFVVIGNKECSDMVLKHELSHLRHRHWIDLLFAQAVCILQWFNPAAWMLRGQLVMTHEFQADQDVLSEGFDEREYQRLLLERMTGYRYKTLLANNLNTNNLKKRIVMMKKRKSRLGSRLSALALLPALALAYFLTCTPAVASVVEETNAVDFTEDAFTRSSAESTEEKVYDVPETLAEFPGGMIALRNWLIANVKFPEELTTDNIQGRVVVKFIIGKTGKVSDVKILKGLDPAADAEAERVVLAMPDWKPGEVGGKPVASQFVLPISFKLQDDTPLPPSSEIKRAPAYFIDGKLYEGDINNIESSSIASMEVVKDDPNYPDGKILIHLKK